jgi:gamma-glutamylcyclotransferase (GGCT)/AIG2-like uncharacterized protein YtfP
MLYFGYGSNLRAAFVTELLPSAKLLMKAYLPNYEVQWCGWSEAFGGGTSSIIETPGEIVEGVIYECSKQELDSLDYRPGIYVPEYKRETFLVLGEDTEWYSADLYRMRDPRGPFQPSRSYVEGMLAGAKEVGLSPKYITKIEGWLEESIVLMS